MTEKETVYFVHSASHRLCINNHTAYQIYSVACMKQVCKYRLWSAKLAIPGQKHSKQNVPERNLQISCHLIFFFLPFLINKEIEFWCRKTTHFEKAPWDWTTGLNREVLPSSVINTKQQQPCNFFLSIFLNYPFCTALLILLKPSMIFCFLFFGETCCCSSPSQAFDAGGGNMFLFYLYVLSREKRKPNQNQINSHF